MTFFGGPDALFIAAGSGAVIYLAPLHKLLSPLEIDFKYS